jgi:hypothetical protein
MAKKPRPEGICHLCGEHRVLSFEHVPPEKAFNDKPAFLIPFEEAIHLGPDDEPHSRPVKQQRGMGGYTLCGPCNSKTGGWYGNQFIQWSYDAAMLLERSDGKPTLLYPYYIHPLPILKQILSCFLSVNSPMMQQRYPDLAHFVLNKEARYLNPRYRFFAYYTIQGRPRQLPFTRSYDIFTDKDPYLSEFTTFPFGYVMTIDSTTPDSRLLDISHFSRYDYDEFVTLTLRFAVLPAHMTIPGDYRTKEEITRVETEEEALERKEEFWRKAAGSSGLALLEKLSSLIS